MRDHPRSRGVYAQNSVSTQAGAGSSPLAQGLHAFHHATLNDGGIIPARAGFTRLPDRQLAAVGDHPRSRGVYLEQSPKPLWSGGSSPLARGLPEVSSATGLGTRIIPARAGFTERACPHQERISDHPRSRGVYPDVPGQHDLPYGSSPLARGLLDNKYPMFNVNGIIPARAGFTLADPWNPNDEPHYQTSFAFTADLALAPQSSDSVVVSQRSTRTPSEA